MSIIISWKVIALLVAATLCVGLAQRGQRRGQEGRGENAQAGQAAQQGTQEGEDFQEEGQEGPRGQGNSDHVRWWAKLTWIAQWWNIKNCLQSLHPVRAPRLQHVHPLSLSRGNLANNFKLMEDDKQDHDGGDINNSYYAVHQFR